MSDLNLLLIPTPPLTEQERHTGINSLLIEVFPVQDEAAAHKKWSQLA